MWIVDQTEPNFGASYYPWPGVSTLGLGLGTATSSTDLLGPAGVGSEDPPPKIDTISTKNNKKMS